MNKNIIFSDLEGTILRDRDNSYSDEDMFNFLQIINNFNKVTNAIPEIHLVSPVGGAFMDKCINKIDKNISSFNSITHSRLPFIHSAYCSENNDIDVKLSSNIIIAKAPTSSNYNSWKSMYVQDICDSMTSNTPNNTINFIYLGNGQNDLRSMEIVKRFKGVVICPQNSDSKVKLLSDFIGKSDDLRGITDGLNQYVKTLIPPHSIDDQDTIIEK